MAPEHYIYRKPIPLSGYIRNLRNKGLGGCMVGGGGACCRNRNWLTSKPQQGRQEGMGVWGEGVRAPSVTDTPTVGIRHSNREDIPCLCPIRKHITA